MTKYIYVKRDRKANYYDLPTYSDLEPKAYIQACARAIVHMADNNQKTILKDCEVVYVGTFDDEKCVFNIGKEEKLFDFSDFLGVSDE